MPAAGCWSTGTVAVCPTPATSSSSSCIRSLSGSACSPAFQGLDGRRDADVTMSIAYGGPAPSEHVDIAITDRAVDRQVAPACAAARPTMSGSRRWQQCSATTSSGSSCTVPRRRSSAKVASARRHPRAVPDVVRARGDEGHPQIIQRGRSRRPRPSSPRSADVCSSGAGEPADLDPRGGDDRSGAADASGVRRSATAAAAPTPATPAAVVDSAGRAAGTVA